MSNELQLACGIIEAEARANINKAESLEDKLKAAFTVAKDHWMFTEKDTQFQAALSAVLRNIDGEEKERLDEEFNSIKALNALLSGVSVNMPEITHEPIGIIGMWKEMAD